MPKAFSPTGSPIVATSDLVPANAMIAEDSFSREADGSLAFEYDGTGSKMCWDGQYTQEIDGKALFVAEDGTEWREDELVLRD